MSVFFTKHKSLIDITSSTNCLIYKNFLWHGVCGVLGIKAPAGLKKAIRGELRGSGGRAVKILWIVGGLLVYLLLIVFITSIFGQNTQDRRTKDRRQQTEDRRENLRSLGRGDRRVKERRSIYCDLPA